MVGIFESTTAVVTGASNGIGLATAHRLAQRGATVVLLSRDPDRTNRAALDVAAAGSGEAHAVVANFDELAQVRRAAAEIAERWPRIDVLVNNAGAILPKRAVTVDGFEQTLQVNYLAPFLLTALLRSPLVAAAPSRVVIVSSDAYKAAWRGFRFGDPELERGWSSFGAYAHTKLADIMWSAELARRWSADGITSNAVHPGVAATGFGRMGTDLAGSFWKPWRRFFPTADDGADTVDYVASSPDVEGMSGQYFFRRALHRPGRQARDEGAQERLWEWTVEALGLGDAGDGHEQVKRPFTSRRTIVVYVTSNVLFTLSASLIWGVNTLFLMGPGGLTIFQVMLVNTAWVVGQAVFEVPTGVVADTVGRKVSYLFGIGTVLVSTLLYVVIPTLGWGVPGFAFASVLLGLGYTFQTGAVDAWLVDALDETGYDKPKDRVFALGQGSAGAAMLIGAIAGGVLGQIGLTLPYVVRSVTLTAAFVFVLVAMREVGFTPRALKLSRFGAETRKILDASVKFGWRDPVVKPLLLVSLASGLFVMFGFYAWQRYMLDLLGQELIWLSGVVQAALSLAMIGGNGLVRPIAGTGVTRRDPGRILAWCAALSTVLAVSIGAVGLIAPAPGIAPFAIATSLWLAFGVVMGLSGPVAQGFINEHIPSQQRATVLSLQAFFGDAGGAAGQPALGWFAEKTSIAASFVVGGATLGLTVPLYAAAGRAARRLARRDGQPDGAST